MLTALFPLNSGSFTSPCVAMVCECQNRVYKWFTSFWFHFIFHES
jgi:hypothetical protein